MGEKYCDDVPRLRYELRPELQLGRIANPVGEGFPPPGLDTMLAGGPSGLAATSEYMARPSETVAGLARSATEEFRAAGDDAAARLGAAQSVTSRLGDGVPAVQKQIAQGNASAQMLLAANSYSREEIGGVMRDASRDLRHTVTQDLGAVEQLVQDGLAMVEDTARNAVATRLEAVVNRFGQVAHRQAAGLYNELLRDDAGDAAESGGTAA